MMESVRWSKRALVHLIRNKIAKNDAVANGKGTKKKGKLSDFPDALNSMNARR